MRSSHLLSSSLITSLLLSSATMLPGAPVLLDDFEFATDNTAAAAGVTTGSDPSVTISAVSGSAADANQGSFSLGLNLAMTGTAFEAGSITRVLPSPVALSTGYNASNPSGTQPGDLHLEVDLKGAAAFAGTVGTNIWVRLYEADGDVWRFINFTDVALGTPSYTDNRAIGFYDREAGSSGDGTLSAITGYQILIQNPEGVAKTGIIHADDFNIVEPDGPGFPTGVSYTVPVILPGQAPNVTDAIFDAIYDNSGGHAAIAGSDWKDWASRAIDPGTPISANANGGTNIAATSKAYLLSDGQYLYFGMIVYDPNTAAMTADTGDDSFTKWNVEDIEVAFSAQSGTAGVTDAVKLSFDGFGHIDDMFPDGNVTVDSSAVVNSNSYIINSTSWACEFRIGLDEMVTLSETALTTPLPRGVATTWNGHIGYQSPFILGNPRVPLYAAGHGNGFSEFTVEYTLNVPVPSEAGAWQLYR